MAAMSNSSQPPLQRPAELPAAFLHLLAVIDQLRSPQGCPWDREQTPQSLTPALLEETYEVIESIHENNPQALQEELGDVLLHVLLQCRIAQEAGQFTIADSLRTIAMANARYRCVNCGYSTQRFIWHCPSCKLWETVRPIQTVPLENVLARA